MTRRSTRRALAAAALLGLVALPIAAQQAAERLDYDAIYRIKEEGFQRSQVMEITSYLTDVHGPRLTNSPSYDAAAEYSMKKMTEWGLVNVKREPWPFGPGWANELTLIRALSPQPFPIIGYSKAWAVGTNGPVSGEAVLVKVDPADRELKSLEEYKGRLRGKVVLLGNARELKAIFDPPATRFTEKDLEELSTDNGNRPRAAYRPPSRQFMDALRKRMQFLKDEGTIAVLDPGRVGDGGTVFVGGVSPRDPKDPTYVPLPQLTIAAEHYGRIARMLEKKIPVTIELNVKNAFYDKDPNSYTIVGEIPGTDRADEVVMIGAHFDSWHAGTGATDNAAGSAVMMEVIRILNASGLRPRRTIRIALWSGEEQGLLGSRAYVKEHFADRETMQLKPEHARLAAYFNVDNGTGAIRGVYLQGNEAVTPIFRAWMEPFRNLGMTTLTIRNTSGTDHLAFDAVGLPGFQFIQDEVEYDTRTHHSNMDVYERIQAPDMMTNAVIVASFTYHAAMRDEKLPRKPLPKPQPPQRTTTMP
ncbi:MAG TPA: M20/M25/M40 family metallo-hydrolase [Vicinamibacterales bacterium]|nr:M20/M25/M40 family metallo-hydrolase [Vicinamibacterales bacterium]